MMMAQPVCVCVCGREYVWPQQRDRKVNSMCKGTCLFMIIFLSLSLSRRRRTAGRKYQVVHLMPHPLFLLHQLLHSPAPPLSIHNDFVVVEIHKLVFFFFFSFTFTWRRESWDKERTWWSNRRTDLWTTTLMAWWAVITIHTQPASVIRKSTDSYTAGYKSRRRSLWGEPRWLLKKRKTRLRSPVSSRGEERKKQT